MKAFLPNEDNYDDGNIPEIDTEPYKDGAYVEPLPESKPPQKKGPEKK